MTPKHVFDSEGFWVAFIVDSEVFLRGGDWLGQLVGENEIRDRNGRLVGVLDERNCLYLSRRGRLSSAVSEKASSKNIHGQSLDISG